MVEAVKTEPSGTVHVLNSDDCTDYSEDDRRADRQTPLVQRPKSVRTVSSHESARVSRDRCPKGYSVIMTGGAAHGCTGTMYSEAPIMRTTASSLRVEAIKTAR